MTDREFFLARRRAGADPEQFAHDLYAVMLGCHHGMRLMRDPASESRARHAMEALLTAARPKKPARMAAAASPRRARRRSPASTSSRRTQ